MATASTPQRQVETAAREDDTEPMLHFFARESAVVLRVLVLLALLGTIVVMVTIFYWAIIPAILLLMFYGLLLIADGVERETRRRFEEAHPGTHAVPSPMDEAEAALEEETDPEKIRRNRISTAVANRLTRIAIIVAGAAAVIAVILAGVFLGWDLVLVGALVIFGYSILVTWPVWLGWMEDDMDEEVVRQEQTLGEEPRP